MGGVVADWLRTRVQGAKLVTSAVGFFVGAPLLLWLLYIRDMDLFIPVFCAAFFFLTWYNGPLTAVIFDVTPRRIATTVSGVYLMFIHLAGDAVAFPLVGWMSDNFGLEKAIIVLPVASVIGAAIVMSAVKAVDGDTARATA
jgi:sugar phosphate permease